MDASVFRFHVCTSFFRAHRDIVGFSGAAPSVLVVTTLPYSFFIKNRNVKHIPGKDELKIRVLGRSIKAPMK